MTRDQSPLTGPSASPIESASDPRLGELVGDRPCAKCGFNLSGQTIVREPHYSLLLVRCPECGTPASLQEYPMLGKWPQRLRFVFGAMLMLAMLASIGLASLLGSINVASAAEAAARPVKLAYQQLHETARKAEGDDKATYWSEATPEWIAQNPPSQTLAKLGGWRALNAEGLYLCVFLFITVLPCAIVLGVNQPGIAPVQAQAERPRSHAFGKRFLRASLVSGLIVVLSLVFLGIGSGFSFYGSRLYPEQVASSYMNTRLYPVGLLFEGIVALCGVLWARPLVRWGLTLLLPPHLRAPWSFLWRIDGKALPRP